MFDRKELIIIFGVIIIYLYVCLEMLFDEGRMIKRHMNIDADLSVSAV